MCFNPIAACFNAIVTGGSPWVTCFIFIAACFFSIVMGGNYIATCFNPIVTELNGWGTHLCRPAPLIYAITRAKFLGRPIICFNFGRPEAGDISLCQGKSI
jgi:hypothetical protein